MDQAIALLSVAQDSAAHVLLAGNVPDPGPGMAPPGLGEKFQQIMGWAKWVCLGVTVLAIMGIGAMMAFGGMRRGEGGEKVGALGWALGGVVIIAGAFSLVGFLAA